MQGSILILRGKAYENLRRKGGEKYREVYLRWVAKPIEKNNRKSEKSNKKVLDLAKITKLLKFAHSKTMDLARKPIEKLAPDLDRGLFGDIKGTDFGRKKWYLYTSLFRIILVYRKPWIWGGVRFKPAFENPGFPRMPRRAKWGPPIHVSGSRSEPGNTRLRMAVVWQANSLKQF